MTLPEDASAEMTPPWCAICGRELTAAEAILSDSACAECHRLGSLGSLVDENGAAPIFGYRCSTECLAFQGYGHHVGCDRVNVTETLAQLRAALAEASTHVHDCEELLTPATRRAIYESVAAVTNG